MANTTSTIYHYYPNHILSDDYKFRSLKIIVKSPEDINWTELKDKSIKVLSTSVADATQQVSDTGGDLVTSMENKVREVIANKSVTPSDIRTSNINKNTKKIQNNMKFIYGACLPLPNELMDTQTHRWDTEKGILGQVIGGVTSGAEKNLGELSSAMGFRKVMMDPGFFQNYTGSSPRSFTFSFDMIPDNEEEAFSIMNIILNLKKYSLPRTLVGTGVSLLAPYLFEIQIGNEYLEKLINMNDVVLTEISVNYGSDGGMQLFSNGVPKFIRMSLSFSERSLVTSEFYD